MKITMHGMAVDSFVPMLASLSGVLDKGIAFAKDKPLDLVNAKLAPDMFTLAYQVMLSCHHARDGVGRLTGAAPLPFSAPGATMAALTAQIADAVAAVRAVPAAAFDGAEDRDCTMPGPNGAEIVMDGLTFLRAWALPHFYFHVVTAYDILRHLGVPVGKPDYLSQVGPFIRRKA